MSEQKQTRLGMQNSILSRARVRQLTPDDLGIELPDQGSSEEGGGEADKQEDMRDAAIEAAERSEGDSDVSAAIKTVSGELYTGVPVGGDGWGSHAVELAVSKALSEGADGVTSAVVYSSDGQQGLCGRCLQSLSDTRNGEIIVEVHSSEGVKDSFVLESSLHVCYST